MRNESVNYSRLMAESQLDRADDWETLAQRDIDLQAAREAQQRAAAEAAAQAQAQADAQAAAEAQFESARAAAIEADTASAPLVMLPTDDEALDQAVLVTDGTTGASGPYTQELDAALAGLIIPEELQLPVDNMRTALGEADALVAQGYLDQGVEMYAAIQEATVPLFTALFTAQQAPAADAPPAASVVQSAAAEAPAEQAKSSPLDLPTLKPNDYFTGSFANPPPGGWFWGIGDAGRTGQEGGVYMWLSAVTAARAKASEHGNYLLAASDQVTTVGAHLANAALYPIDYEVQVYEGEGGSHVATQTRLQPRGEAIAELRNRGLDDNAIAAYLGEHEQFMVQPAFSTGGDGGSDVPAVYGTRDAYLNAIGLSTNVPMDLQIAFNSSSSGGGDAWLSASRSAPDLWNGPEKAFVAIVDDTLAAEYVQIGDIGPINDDVNEMLGSIYERYGATTPEAQDAIRNVLFKYDERFGVMASREFVEAAVEKNNARRQGFFEGSLGRTLLTVAVSFIPYAGPYLAIALNAGFQLSDGASFGQVVAGAVVSYFTQQYTAEFGNYVAGAFGDSISPAVAGVIAAGARNLGNAAINQLMSGNGLDGKGLLLAAAAGGFGSYITSFVDSSDFGRALDEQFGRGRAGDIIGRLGASAVDGKITASDFAGAFAAGRADQVSTVEGTDGTHAFVQNGNTVFAINPDGSITQLEQTDDGQVIATTYDSQGNKIVSADAYTGALANPVWRTATLSDAVTSGFDVSSFSSGLTNIFGLDAGSVTLTDFTGDYASTLALFGDMTSGGTPAEIHALEEGGYGLNASMPTFLPDGDVNVTPPPAQDLTSQTYSKDKDGLETWRNPETGAIVYQKSAAGVTLAVVGDRRVVSDAQGKVVSVQGGTFGDAVRQARSSGSAVFEWNGKDYTTITKVDIVRQSGLSVSDYERYVKDTGDSTIEGFKSRITDNQWKMLSQAGVDSKYWQGIGFTPQQVVLAYAVNGNDHRLATMQAGQNNDVTTQGLATTFANNLAKLPQGFSDVAKSAIGGFSDLLMSQQVGGQEMTALEAAGAVVSKLIDVGKTATQRLIDNTDSKGEMALVAAGATLNLAWDATGGAVERAYKTMQDPNSTPQQVAVSSLEFFGAVFSFAGASTVIRSATSGAGLAATTVDGLAGAGSATTRTLLDSAGFLLPDSPGSSIKHVDFVGTGPTSRLSTDIASVDAAIAAVDLNAEATRMYKSLQAARELAEVHIHDMPELGGTGGSLGNYQLYLKDGVIDYQLVGATVTRAPDGSLILPRTSDGIEFIGYNPLAMTAVRHEAGHIVDYATAALDPGSPLLLRMDWPSANGGNYKAFSYTELNGFMISAEEASQAYKVAMKSGDLEGANRALNVYASTLGGYDGMLQRVEQALSAGFTHESRALLEQTLSPIDKLPKNPGFEVVTYQVVGLDGLPVKMQAEIPKGLAPDQMAEAITTQMTNGVNELDRYFDMSAQVAQDLAALKAHFQQNFSTPSGGNGSGLRPGRGRGDLGDGEP